MKFHKNLFLNYSLDLLDYYAAQGHAFDAMLKHIGILLELFTEMEIMLSIEKCIQG